MTTAETVVRWALGALVVVVLLVGALDLGLFLDRQPTVSAWLRGHPAYFWVPAKLIVLALVLLALHLFVWTWPE